MENLQFNEYIDFKTRVYQLDSLNDKEEAELFLRFQKDDHQAKEEIIKANLKYAVSIAERYVKKKCDSDYYMNNIADYVQQSVEGLLNAINNYNPDNDVSFRTYAAFWIKKQLYAYDRSHAAIHITDLRYRLVLRLSEFEHAYMLSNDKEPPDEEIADNLDISLSEVRSLKQIRERLKKESLSNVTWEEDSYTDSYPALDQMDEHVEVQKILARLENDGVSDLDIRIVKVILGEKQGLTNKEISKRTKCPVSTVNYRLRKLRPHFEYLMSSH